MGVPKLFRWLSQRYPLCNQPIHEAQPPIDRLYLDLNGIIHPCFHPDDEHGVRRTEPAVFAAIFNTIDVIVRIVRPRELIYLAVDGVAPQAKINQQRARRFQTAANAAAQGVAHAAAPAVDGADPPLVDSNAITPGTAFMARLAEHLRYYAARRVSDDPAWRNLQVVLSGPEVPGEGEHKIMEFIRTGRAQPGYRPTTTHCLYGADADLLLLGLLSHEPNFCVLREVFMRTSSQLRRAPSLEQYALVHLSILRDYLAMEFAPLAAAPALQHEFAWERVFNDLVALTFLVGNDFLPNAPALYIPNGALDVLWEAYLALIPSLGGFLTALDGTVAWDRLGAFLRRLAEHEAAACFEGVDADVAWMRQRLRSPPAGPPDAPDAPAMGAAGPPPPREPAGTAGTNGAAEGTLTPSRRRLAQLIRTFVFGTATSLRLPTVHPEDRAFVLGLAEEINLEAIESVRRTGLGITAADRAGRPADLRPAEAAPRRLGWRSR